MAPGTRPEPGEHRFPGTIFGPAHLSVPLKLAARRVHPNPLFASARPGPPFPGRPPRPGLSPTRRPAPPPAPGRAGAPRSRFPPRPCRDAAVPEPPRARGSTPLQPLLPLTPPAAPRYLRAASWLLSPQSCPLGGGDGTGGSAAGSWLSARRHRRARAQRSGASARAQKLAPSGSGRRGGVRRARSLLHTARCPASVPVVCPHRTGPELHSFYRGASPASRFIFSSLPHQPLP